MAPQFCKHDCLVSLQLPFSCSLEDYREPSWSSPSFQGPHVLQTGTFSRISSCGTYLSLKVQNLEFRPAIPKCVCSKWSLMAYKVTQPGYFIPKTRPWWKHMSVSLGDGCQCAGFCSIGNPSDRERRGMVHLPSPSPQTFP